MTRKLWTMPGQCLYDVAEDADALILATEWNEFKQIDFNRIASLMKGKVIFDTRNQWDGAALKKMGFEYYGVGKNTRG